MSVSTPDNLALGRFAAGVAVCTWLLVIAGGRVTSDGAALAAHRIVAVIVAALTVTLAVWLERTEPRRWLRRLGWAAVAAVAAQAALGAAAAGSAPVLLVAMAHASLAQICFGLLVAVAVGEAGLPRPATVVAAGALFAQTILGAAVRHGAVPVTLHMACAAVPVAAVMWAALQILSRHMHDARLRRPAMWMLSLTLSQVFLGLGAFMGRAASAAAPQPIPVMTWFALAHVAAGSLAFGAAVALAMRDGQFGRNAELELHGGAVAA
jgi:heme a synthase